MENYPHCVAIKRKEFSEDLKKIASIANYLRNQLCCRHPRDYRISSDNEYHYYHFSDYNHAELLRQSYGTN